ncbi:hypothetical protein FSP39_010300 [Pinctada imbricata]|uniref:Rab-like protein 5 n=1 Tax=Pinctada imbricata TaxID=66713 RepID=A0AA88XGR8_PINIB|nr:hypothetical protein FSP39_010300 [Pinctada imbricata]
MQSGKTVLSNFMADATETSSGEYHPTQGCRNLCHLGNLDVRGNSNFRITLVVWEDVQLSGDLTGGPWASQGFWPFSWVATETSSGEYHPTQGCRILEFESTTNSRQGIEVEMWDVSGDRKFEQCWPAIAKDTNGVIFVFNPDQANHDKDLENWYNYFVENQGLKDSQCVVFAHHKPGVGEKERSALSDTFRKMSVIQTNIEDDPDSVRAEFMNYLTQLMGTMSDKREQEELSIMNQR